MALIKCSECGKEISDKAASCPHCGCPVSKITDIQCNTTTSFEQSIYENDPKAAKKKNKPLPFIIIGGIIMIAIIAILIASLAGGEKGNIASNGISKVTDGKITGSTETELAIIIDMLYLSRDDVISVFPDAQDEGTKIVIPGTFAGSIGQYKAFLSSDGNHFDQVIFERDSDEYDSEAVVDELCEYLGDYSEYDSEWNKYEWLTDDLELLFYVDERMYFYETSSIIKNKSNNIDDEDNKSDSKNNIQSEEDQYALVKKYISEEKYEDALELMATLEQNDEIIDSKKECTYQIALTLEDASDAYDAFSSLGDYKDAEEKAKESYYNIGLHKLDIGFNKDAYLIFHELGDYKDSADKAKESVKGEEEDFYEEALELYLDGELTDAKIYLEGCADYEDAAILLKYVNTIEEYQGVYVINSAYERKYIVIDGCELIVYDLHDGDKDYNDVVLTEYGDSLCFVSKYHFEDPENVIFWWYPEEIEGEKQIRERSLSDSWRDEGDIYYKTDRTKAELDASVEGVDKPVNPRVGMTAEEVENSTWGPPIKKNIRTYEWGTTEQWVYFGDRYIYLENDIVTSISE